MKTLDKVIKALEWCVDDSHDDCDGCPYDTGEVTDCHERNIDALHYLKEYRKHLAQESDELRQKKYELETNMKLDALLQEKPWEKRK